MDPLGRVEDHPCASLLELKGKKVHLKSFGCTYNLATTLRMEQALIRHGCHIVPEADAQAVVVNTCTVIGRTDRQVLACLRSTVTKEQFVMGCMARTQMDRIREVCSPRVIGEHLIDEESPLPGAMIGGAMGVVQIAQGCLGSCSYCITRKARGALRSEPEESILTTVSMLVRQGAREVQLTAQDVAAWGVDRNRDLLDLLAAVVDLPGSFRLRLGMMNPTTLLPFFDELLPFYSHPRMYQFMHVPIQSGSDEILAAMDREYSRDQCLHLAARLRKTYPDLWLCTDIIAGFPGETDAAFQQTLDLLRMIRPNKVNITRFSARPGTDAGHRPEVLERVKKERSRHLTRCCASLSHNQNRAWIGRIVPVVAVEQVKNGSVTCRSPHYRSIVIHDPLPLGAGAMVRITHDRTHFFTGELVVRANDAPSPWSALPPERPPVFLR